ncbi:serine/threonine protein kinase [Novosphingobium soli]|uniref:Serine/threonine protein kinase n=1 Tax=Novosphingobium soli TaxID=574956 RepID=A0ABV6D1Y1_9SPHN
MNDEKDETVFQPSQFGQGDPQAAPRPADGGEEGTAFAAPAPPPPPAPPVDDEGTVFAAPTPPPSPAPARARGTAAAIEVGTVLNHMFEVKRFLARGGMGEVFEGVNIASGERVAIKTILPELAADPNVMAMFQKEAQALTQLSHPAVVRYRGFALEPQLGLYYIATGFIEGRNLSDLLGKSTLSEDELFGLTRKLAEGLREAHELGVVHRDISPDNVLLDGDRLDRPKIIDFGIVKETDPGSKTIIGDGFAGKPSYVAPEQLGDFDKQVGPWSDVYALALVVLAMAQGRKPDLAGLPAEAIMKRRNGVDTSAVPARLRPVIDRMLVADPQKRLRTMDAVIAALDQALAGKTPRARKPAATAAKAKAAAAAATSASRPSRPLLIGGGALVAVALLAGIGYLVAGGSDTDPTQPAAPPPPGGVTLQQVDAAVQSAARATPCSWLSLETRPQGNGFSVAGTGVSGSPLDVQDAVLKTTHGLGVEPGTDLTGIARIDPSYCPVLDALAPFRAPPPERMTRKQPEYELDVAEQGEYAGQIGTRVVTDLALEGITGDYALYSIEKSNVIAQVFGDRSFLPQNVNGTTIQKLPGIENYRLNIDTNAQPGWSGLVLITGKGGFTPDALNDLVSPAGRTAFAQRARANDWKVQIVWYKFVDNQPNAAAPAT